MSFPEAPDPSKVAILKTSTPLLYRFKPLDWRVPMILRVCSYTNQYQLFGVGPAFSHSAELRASVLT